MLLTRERDYSLMETENDFSRDFTPYSKIANRIDEVLSAINFSKMVGDISNAIKLKNELYELRLEIKKIRGINKSHR